MIQKVRLSDVVAKESARRSDLALETSMTELGLFHPIVVNSKLELIAGHRRLAAARKLGWTEIEANVSRTLDDAILALKAERDENTCREAMPLPELAALGRRLEELERPKARERMVEAHASPGNLTELGTGRVRDKVAEALGMSGRTYEKLAAVDKAANNPDEPEAVREVAKNALEHMATTGKVDAGFKAVEAARKGGAKEGTMEKEDKKSGPKPKLGPPCRAMQCARIAIMNLSEIEDDDIEREQAFDTIGRWLDEHRSATKA